MLKLLDFAPDDLGDDLAARVHALLHDTWPEDAPNEGDYYRTHGAPGTVVILRQAQDVVAHLAIYERQVGIGSETLEIAMLGGIVVAPEQRRRGHCRALVCHAHERLSGRSIHFSILFAYEPAVYVSSGYKLMQNATRFVDADGTPKTLVYRGSMYAELSRRRWPDQTLDLRGRVV
jgi:predicted acetyltransferase